MFVEWVKGSQIPVCSVSSLPRENPEFVHLRATLGCLGEWMNFNPASEACIIVGWTNFNLTPASTLSDFIINTHNEDVAVPVHRALPPKSCQNPRVAVGLWYLKVRWDLSETPGVADSPSTVLSQLPQRCAELVQPPREMGKTCLQICPIHAVPCGYYNFP